MCPPLERSNNGELIFTDEIGQEHIIPVLHVEDIEFHLNRNFMIQAIKKIFDRLGVSNVTVMVRNANEVEEEIDDDNEYREIVIEHLILNSEPFVPIVMFEDAEGRIDMIPGLEITVDLSPNFYRYGQTGGWYDVINFEPSGHHQYRYLSHKSYSDERPKVIYSDNTLIVRDPEAFEKRFNFQIQDIEKSKYNPRENIFKRNHYENTTRVEDINNMLGMDNEGLYIQTNIKTKWIDRGSGEIKPPSVFKGFLRVEKASLYRGFDESTVAVDEDGGETTDAQYTEQNLLWDSEDEIDFSESVNFDDEETDAQDIEQQDLESEGADQQGEETDAQDTVQQNNWDSSDEEIDFNGPVEFADGDVYQDGERVERQNSDDEQQEN